MREEVKARYRNKLKKIIVEVWNGEKWIYVKTLSEPLVEFRAECLAKVSLKQGETNKKEPQKFPQSLLSEPQKQDTMRAEEDILRGAREAQEKIMKEVMS